MPCDQRYEPFAVAYAERTNHILLELDTLGTRFLPSVGGGMACTELDADGNVRHASETGFGLRTFPHDLMQEAQLLRNIFSRGSPTLEVPPCPTGEWLRSLLCELNDEVGDDANLSIRLNDRAWASCCAGQEPVRGSASTAQIILRQTNGLPSISWAGSPAALAHGMPSEFLQGVKHASQPQSPTHIPDGPHRTLLSPEAAIALVHEVIGHALEGDRALQGSRLWTTRHSLRITSELTVVEDGTHPEAWEHSFHDDEGSTIEPLPLIEAGSVQRLVTDKLTAAMLGTRSSAGGRRESYRRPAVPRVRHTRVLPGSASMTGLLTLIDDGVMVERVAGGHADTTTGTFTLHGIQAYKITNSTIGEPLTFSTIRGDLSALERILAIGTHPVTKRFSCGKGGVWLRSSASAPAIAIDGLELHR